jgi:uncharacterized circularly permuted ATP-grasp superfamily protein/uncharacterized alpha-E superfamily protein
VVSQEPDLSDLHRVVEVAGFDEMLDDDGELRDHWRYVIGSLRLLGESELSARQREVTDLLRQDGASHDLDPSTGRSSGALDLIPLLVSSEDWASIETGLVQRAELLDLVLDDLYGPQELVQRGLLPVEVLHRHPGYLRPLHGDRGHPGEHRLVHHSADLARGADGRFVVLGDRTRVPTGSGLALEHRLIVSRVFPSLFRDSHVHRLAHYFRGMRRALLALAPPERDDPRIVVLTDGPASAAYFEHSYLASYLGYPLVEPGDLTVRRGRVWLRALDGLQQVDVVLRGVPDEACDPLELRSGVGNGVPGLVEAARRGNVALANPLGAAVVESPGLLPFLGPIAEHFLGAELSLPSVEAWWCGNERSLAEVLDQLDELVLVPVDRQDGDVLVDGATLGPGARDDVVAELRAQPGRWIAERLPEGGWSPSLVGDRLEARPSALRAFVTAREGSYVAMPGGIGRVMAPGTRLRVPHPADRPQHTWSKDLWVLASEPERQGTSLLTEPAQTGSGPLVLPSPPTIAGSLPTRAAENLYWVGRYAERAEQIIRWGRTVLGRVSDAAEQAGTDTPGWLLDLDTALTRLSGDGLQPGDDIDDLTAAVMAQLFASDAGGLVEPLRRLAAASVSVRELLASDTWQVIDAIEDELDRIARFPPTTAAGAQRVLGRLLGSLFALSGLTAESIVRDPVWLFLDAGRRIERAHAVVTTSTATLVRARDADSDALVHESVLSANDSLITYRRRYRSRLRIASVLELLLGDPSNPRSLVYQIDRLIEHSRALPVGAALEGLDREEIVNEVAERAQATSRLLRGADLAGIANPLDGDQRVALAGLLAESADSLDRLGEAVGRHFLHVEPPRTLDRTVVAGR